MTRREVILKIVKFRWLFAFFIFVVCVLFQIHGSSIGEFNKIFPTVLNEQEVKEYKVFGESRPIRSDEWAVYTPKCFAQKFNNFEKYSNQMSEGKTDTVLDYYAPSFSLETIGRPFNWGYLLFGNAYGLSFNWCMLIILLFMTAFEMFYIITKKSIVASTIGMAMVGFSPALQWWVFPHMPILFVYSMGIFCLLYYFFTLKKVWQHLLTGILSVISLVGFCISIFPSCQVVCALLVLVMTVSCLLRDREDFNFNKLTALKIVLVAGLTCFILIHFLITSKEGLLRILQTSYPGARKECGGNRKLEDLFTSLYSVFLPTKDSNVLNNSEIATFIHFAPFFLVFFHKIAAKLKENFNRQLIFGRAIFVFLLVEIVFMCIGFTPIMSEITMFRYVNRMNICYGFTAVIFTVWAFHVVWTRKDMFNLKGRIFYPCFFGVFNLALITPQLRQYIGLFKLSLQIFYFVLILILVVFNFKKLAGILIIGFMFVSGFFVNPINRGISPIVNHPISKFVAETVSKNSEARWIVLGDGLWMVSNFLLANGAKVLSSTNFYPDIEKWKVLGIDGRYYELYNRYANQDFSLVDGDQFVELGWQDYIRVRINAQGLENLKIDYFLTRTKDLNQEVFRNLSSEEVFRGDGFSICQLIHER